MTRKGYLAVAGLLVLLLVAGFSATLMMPPVPGVTKANFDRIQDGMTEKEVQAILGGTGVPYVSFRDPGDLRMMSSRMYVGLPPGVDGIALEGWFFHAPRSQAYVGFSNGHVDGKKWFGQDETILNKLRRSLRL